jgi:hypothetical protein
MTVFSSTVSRSPLHSPVLVFADHQVPVVVPGRLRRWWPRLDQCPGAYTDAAGHVWVPLEVPVGVSGSGMIAVAEQAEAVIAAIRAALV